MLVNGSKSEAIPDLNCTCYPTDDPLRFVGILEFQNDAAKKVFLSSTAFASYREAVAPTFANPPQTVAIKAIASTRN